MVNGMNNLRRVTDKSLLEKLNSGPRKVTDTSVLQKLNSNNEENLLKKLIRYGVKDPAIGVLNMGREFANLPHKVSGGRIPELSPSDFNFGETVGVENPEPMDKLIQGLSQYAPSIALPGVVMGRAGQAINMIPKAGKFISKAISETIPQAIYSATQSPGREGKAAAQSSATMLPLSILMQLMEGSSPKIKAAAKILAGGGAAL